MKEQRPIVEKYEGHELLAIYDEKNSEGEMVEKHSYINSQEDYDRVIQYTDRHSVNLIDIQPCYDCYYIEIFSKKNDEPYTLQSKPFKTEEDAKNWALQIDFLDLSYTIRVMGVEYVDKDNEEEGYEIVSLYDLAD